MLLITETGRGDLKHQWITTDGIAACGMQISGDPRRPQEVRNFVPPVVPEDAPGDFRLVGSMMFGLAAMLTKVSSSLCSTPPADGLAVLA